MAASGEVFEQANFMSVLNESIEDNAEQMKHFHEQLINPKRIPNPHFDYCVEISNAVRQASVKLLFCVSASLRTFIHTHIHTYSHSHSHAHSQLHLQHTHTQHIPAAPESPSVHNDPQPISAMNN